MKNNLPNLEAVVWLTIQFCNTDYLDFTIFDF